MPVAVAQAFGDVEPLVSEVVELEHERIGLAAVDARPLAKEGHEVVRRARLRARACGGGHSRRSARGALRSARVCSPPGMAGSSCRAAREPSGARRSPTAACAVAAPAGSRGARGCAITNICSHAGRTDRAPNAGARLSVESTRPRGVAQSGSAPGWGPGGRRFKSCLPDEKSQVQNLEPRRGCWRKPRKRWASGSLFSPVPGCSRHAGPQRDRSDGPKGPQATRCVASRRTFKRWNSGAGTSLLVAQRAYALRDDPAAHLARPDPERSPHGKRDGVTGWVTGAQ